MLKVLFRFSRLLTAQKIVLPGSALEYSFIVNVECFNWNRHGFGMMKTLFRPSGYQRSASRHLWKVFSSDSLVVKIRLGGFLGSAHFDRA